MNDFTELFQIYFGWLKCYSETWRCAACECPGLELRPGGLIVFCWKLYPRPSQTFQLL